MLGFCKAIVRRKRAKGMLPMAAHKLNDMGEYMYEPLPPENTDKSSHCSSSHNRTDGDSGAIDSGRQRHDLSPSRTSCRHYVERTFYLSREDLQGGSLITH